MTAVALIACAILSVGCQKGPRLASSVERWGQDPANIPQPRLIIVGDSIALGWGNSLSRPGILVHAIGGQQIGTIEENFAADAIAYNPQAILIEGGINDILARKSVDRIIQSRINMVRQAKAHGIKVYLANLTPYNPAECGGSGNDDINTINAVSAAMCADGSCTLVDFNGALGNNFDQSLFNGCVHPNDLGNARMTGYFDGVFH